MDRIWEAICCWKKKAQVVQKTLVDEISKSDLNSFSFWASYVEINKGYKKFQ